MAKISFILVFSFVVALPFLSVLAQEDSWQDLIGQQGTGFSQTLDEAKKALNGASDAASGEALNDYLGGDEGDAAESSLADLIDSENNTGTTSSPITDSPVGAPEDLPADDVYTSPSEASLSPAGAPQTHSSSPSEAPQQAPTNAPLRAPANAPTNAPLRAPAANAPLRAPTANAPLRAPAANAPLQAPAANAPLKTPGNAPVEAPQSERDLAPTNAPIVEAPEGAPSEAPVGEPVDDEDDDDVVEPEWAPTNAPAKAPEGAALDES